MKYAAIRFKIDNRGVATLTLNQPEKHNAMSGKMISELSDVAAKLAKDPSVRVVILTGEGKSFCAGGDLDWMRAQFEADRETRISEAMKLARMLGALNDLPKPLIGRINGQAFGGGIGMISICDIAFGVDTAWFGLTETRLGLIPATISPYVIAKMGEGKARQVFMSGRRFDADEAMRLGLLSNAISKDELDQVVEKEVAQYLKSAPGAVAKAKALAASFSPSIDEAVMLRTANLLADCWEDIETQKGIAAFFEKRDPPWLVKD